MSENQKKVTISIKNNTDKEFNDVSIFNSNFEKEFNRELEFSFPTLEDGTPFLDFLSTLKEPKKVELLRYQYNCEDSNNEEKQLDSKFSVWLDKKITSYHFMDFFLRHQQQRNILGNIGQQQRNILDIMGDSIELNLYDLDILLERIMPKTSVDVTFFFND